MAERAENKEKLVEFNNKIKSFRSELIKHSLFIMDIESFAAGNEEQSSSVEEIKKKIKSVNATLKKVDKLCDVKNDAEFTGEALQDINIKNNKIAEKLKEIQGLTKKFTQDYPQYNELAKRAENVAKAVATVNKALKELGKIDDPADRDTMAGEINGYRDNYNWKTTAAKEVLAKLDKVYPALYENFTTVNELLTEIVEGKTSLRDQKCEGLHDAINFLIGKSDSYGENRQPKITTKVDVPFKKNAFAKKENLEPQNVTMTNLGELLRVTARTIFDNLPSHHKKGSTANKVVKGVSIGLAVAIALTGLAVGVYHGVEAAKKAGAAPFQDQLNSQKEEDQESIASTRKKISDYITQVNGMIDSVVSNSENWSARVGGDKALEDLKFYQDGTNENLTALNNANLTALATNELSAAQQLYAQATTAYNAIINDLTDIEESVGGFKDVNVSNAIIKGISQDSLKGWQQAFTKSQVLAINISDIRTQEADGEDSALVRIIFQKNNGEKYITEGEVAGVSKYYQDGELSADDIGALLENKQGKVQIYKDYSSYYSSHFGTSDKIYLYGVENVLAGQAGSSVEYFVYSSTGQLVTRGEILYNNISQNATKDMILQAVEDAIYGQNEM